MPTGPGLYSVTLAAAIPGITWAFPEEYVDPQDFFSAYAGTYGLTSGSDLFFEVSAAAVTTDIFHLTSMTISVAAVPEPSTYVAWLGIAGLGLALCCRRHARTG